ncbi:glycosyltransferase family 2 protein [Chishuiella changwenlii]|jgi:glycosyltransferase involved in cell wall biosynthesis|uniref:glycosyltransferase family 2 protein n=1 Tax=Chishuiella changwenlii TaxID=1434701 RepID=UPI002FD9CAED
MKKSASAIITTYNKAEWLEKVLWGYIMQDTLDFEIIIADDGSCEKTSKLIEEFKANHPTPIFHVWHEDNGFQKTKILNAAILKSNTDYLIFTDDDCIPRKDFVSTHLKLRKKQQFLSGGYCKLSMKISKAITINSIKSQECFDINWLEKIEPISFKNKLKLYELSWFNQLTPTKPTWNGHNSSGWKSDILKVNGFDERMKYGGEDRELGERLENNEIIGKQIRYSAICIHLDHERGYINQADLDVNINIRQITKKESIKMTPCGIIKN